MTAFILATIFILGVIAAADFVFSAVQKFMRRAQ
jgi:hypothetical protein